MKRILASVLVCVMLVCLTACGSKTENAEAHEKAALPAEVQDRVDELLADMNGGAGGWENQSDKEIPQKAKEAFAKAAELAEQPNYTLVSLLGTQVVSGTNYCFLCQRTDTNVYQVVYVYENSAGEAEITDVLDMEISE